MYEGLYAKFSQNDALRRALLLTSPRCLCEVPDGSQDTYWFGGPKGSNRLGELLMEVRTALTAIQEQSTSVSTSPLLSLSLSGSQSLLIASQSLSLSSRCESLNSRLHSKRIRIDDPFDAGILNSSTEPSLQAVPFKKIKK